MDDIHFKKPNITSYPDTEEFADKLLSADNKERFAQLCLTLKEKHLSFNFQHKE